MGFQTQVNALQAPGVAGDFASQNPRASVLAAPGQLVAPAGGLIVGHFAFVNPTTGAVSQAYTAGDQIGFLARESQALITTFLADNTLVVPEGFPVTLYDEGEFLALFAVLGTAGAEVYASTTDGSVQVASSGGVDTGFKLRSNPAAGELGYISSWGV
jgi:hypothetical protein